MTMMSPKSLPFLLYLFIITCSAKNIIVRQCDKLRSCGNIHNISYPFRLRGQPENCGEPLYELGCNNNQPSMNFKGVEFNVQSINLENLTIRVVEASVQRRNCSTLPIGSVDVIDPRLFYYEFNQKLKFLSCEKPLVNHSLFVDTKPCVNGSVIADKKMRHNFSYVTTGIMKVNDLADTCSVDLVTMSADPKCGLNCSYSQIHDSMAYGFELSWRRVACEKYCEFTGSCYLGDSGNVIVSCGVYELVLFSGLGGLGYLLMGIGVRLVIGLPFLSGLLIYKWRRRHLSMYDSVEMFLQIQNNLRPVNYSFSAIKNITKDFKDKLGEGGYGSVYKGRIYSGHVAVKVLGKSKSNGQEFINEVATIGRIHHVNVVRLIGFCAERSKRALVYEFMPNGSLEKYLFPNGGNASFGVEKMLEISIGVARGIEYLHKGCDMRILHFDIKPHNILLDDNFIPKVSDFGLARLYPTDGQSIVSMTAARGTIGYIAPELFYRNIGGVSHKADVYSFGMLLLEMTGKRRMPKESSQVYFHSWVYDQVCSGNSMGIDNISADETRVARKMVIVGLWCIQTRPDDRPSMNRVIEMLNSEIESLEIPAKPCLYVEEEIDPASSSVLLEDSEDSSSLIINVN